MFYLAWDFYFIVARFACFFKCCRKLDLGNFSDHAAVNELFVLTCVHVVHIQAVNLALVEKKGKRLANAVLVQNIRERKRVDLRALADLEGFNAADRLVSVKTVHRTV